MNWTKKQVIDKITEISNKGFIPIPEGAYRKDDGVVGQVLEREFGVEENNLHIADLGTYELKGMRKTKGKTNKLTLFHKTSTSGLKPNQIFERFHHVAPGKTTGELRKKFFNTVKGTRQNKLGLILKASSESAVDLYYKDEYLATWDLTEGRGKIKQILLALAETEGALNSKEERFHFVEAYILSEPKDIGCAIDDGSVVIEFCIDQPADESKRAHDRGPHVRIPIKKLDHLFGSIEKVL